MGDEAPTPGFAGKGLIHEEILDGDHLSQGRGINLSLVPLFRAHRTSYLNSWLQLALRRRQAQENVN